MHWKKKIWALCMLFILVAPLFSFIYYLYAKSRMRYEMEEWLENAALERVSVPFEGLTWVKYGKEVRINGKLFDVKSFTKTSNQITLTGLYDSKEDELHHRLNKMLDQEDDPLQYRRITSLLLIPLYSEQDIYPASIRKLPALHYYFSYAEKIPLHPIREITHPPGT